MKAKEYAARVESSGDRTKALKSVISDILKEGQDLMDKRPGNPLSCIWEAHHKYKAVISRLNDPTLNPNAFLKFVTNELEKQGADVTEFKLYLEKQSELRKIKFEKSLNDWFGDVLSVETTS